MGVNLFQYKTFRGILWAKTKKMKKVGFYTCVFSIFEYK